MSEYEERVTERPQRRGIRKSVYIVPSLLTTANIFCGFYSVTESLRGSVAVSTGSFDEAAVHFTFDSAEALGAAMGSERTGEVMADVANYTTITPVTQMSEIVG